MIDKGDVLTINNNDYLVTEISRYEDIDYLFVNKLLNGEISKEYYVMQRNENGVIIVTDNKILDIILPIFANKVQKDIDLYNETKKFEIED